MWSPSRPNGSPSQPSVPEPKTSSPSVNPAPVVSRPRSDERITYIGKTLVIKGEVSGSEPIHIEGKIEGPISLRDSHINVGRDAVVSSDVQAGEVIVRGTLDGNVTARDRVEVHSGGSLTGETLTVNEREIVSLPPLAVPPSSFTVTVITAEPERLAAGV